MVALILVWRGYMFTEQTHNTEGLLTHVGMADCFITLPHTALECGIVTAWWQCQVDGDTAMGCTPPIVYGPPPEYLSSPGMPNAHHRST